MADFARLILCPEAALHLSSIDVRAAQLEELDLLKNIVSSANNRWFIGGQFRATLTPGSVPSRRAFWQNPDSTSVHKMNK